VSNTVYGDISPKLAAYSAAKMLSHAAPTLALDALSQTPRITVDPLDIECRYCGAEAGEKCVRWRRHRKGKFRAPRTPHPDRTYDAKSATIAARALVDDQ
jgi:hypothetical protein